MKGNMKLEDYPALGSMVCMNLKRDIEEFMRHYTNIDQNYVEKFENALSALSATDQRLVQRREQVALTASLYTASDKLADNTLMLASYMRRAHLHTREVSYAAARLRRRDAEAGIATMREVLAYATKHINLLTDVGGMPANFLQPLATDLNNVQRLNDEQNYILSQRRKNTDDNRSYYFALYDYIAEVCAAGKQVFRNDPEKRRQYNITALRSLLAATKKAEAEAASKEAATQP